MNKKAKKTALKSAVLGKFRDGEVVFVEDFGLDKPSTKALAECLKRMEISGSCLIVQSERSDVVWKSARNIPKTGITTAADLNAYDVLWHKHLLITTDGFEALKKRLENE